MLEKFFSGKAIRGSVGFRTLSGMLKNTAFRKPDLFPSSGGGVGDTNSVGSVRANHNHWIVIHHRQILITVYSGIINVYLHFVKHVKC
jgi:hypothetical protein